MFGICYGFQVMAAARWTGRPDRPARVRADCCATTESVLFAGQPAEQSVWMSHGDAVVRAPDGCDVVATTAATPVAAFGAPVATTGRCPIPPRSPTPTTVRPSCSASCTTWPG